MSFVDRARDRTGSVAVEFAMVLPVLAVLLFATIQCGITLNNYIELANGVSAGARQLSIERGSASPYTATLTAVEDGAPNLSASKITVTTTVGTTACTSANQNTSTCLNAFTLTTGTPCGCAAIVTATYPCDLNVMHIKISSCILTSSAQELVQ